MKREHLAPSQFLVKRPRFAPRHVSPEREAVAVISAALGCSQDAAFDELIDVAMHHHVSVGCPAESLICLVGNAACMTDSPVIVPQQWAELRRRREAKSRTAGAGA